jgi:WD40 repeat protein
VIVVGFHPQGHLLATGDTSGRFQFWHVATGRAIGPSLMHDYPATSLDFSPDGRTLATSAHDVRARLWQVPEPMTGTPQKITRAIQILTRSELDADGVIRPLTKEEVDQRLRPSAEACQK